jgi:hypothetical protein
MRSLLSNVLSLSLSELELEFFILDGLELLIQLRGVGGESVVTVLKQFYAY